MRAAVKAAKVVASVGATAPATAGDQSGLTPEQLLQFAEWIKANPNVNTMSRLPVVAAAETGDALRYRFLRLCEYCNLLHSLEVPWCPASLGMAEQAPMVDPTWHMPRHAQSA